MTAANNAGTQQPTGSSFYTAMRVLPRPRRKAMYALYAFCRAVDDVADSIGPPDERMRELENWRIEIEHLFAGRPSERLSTLALPIRCFGLQQQDFLAVIEGMEMDVAGRLRAPDWATLELYCDRVASAVGRLSARIFGLESEHADALANHLGRALQLTNILRDLDEDAVLGRLYLPREALVEAGITEDAPEVVLVHPRIGEVCTSVVKRAAGHFGEADRIMLACPRALVRAPRLMAAAYGTLLEELVTRGWDPPREPVHVGRLRLFAAILRYGVI
ncbi:presqualene diphosphate synthase HpnD [Microvirga massiliensis]|uniref:presqualene diphosphate synthase HpnD n=1 Tax=Microvirga massiliensis TaxID=1033741 RepID=UPI00062B51AA|nr:presqualene diphosphate synthase HpnD [Microvirga massiliensis]